jgi:putative hydrolase of HD superfamily
MTDILRFYEQAAKLKSLKRAGWVQCGMGECESVADHSFGVALLALLLTKDARPAVNRERCVALALVHDLAEAIVGDITPRDGIPADEKRSRELAAMRELAGVLGNDEVLKLWEEFELGETSEAKLVRELDVIEMAWQAKAYELAKRLSNDAADGFVKSANERVTSSAGRTAMAAIRQRQGCEPFSET